jgi:aspartate kinase
MITDQQFGCATPELNAVRERARQRLVPLMQEGRVPVLGGFIGSTVEGETTTLGRGGSDTSAAYLGAALEADEIQVWTDVDGLMSADPQLVPTARTLPRVSFSEAAELAFYGARVLHPASVAPAVQREIPVRVLNSLRPEADGTVVAGERPAKDAPPLAAVASRPGVTCMRISSRSMRADSTFVPQVLRIVGELGIGADIVISSELALTLVVPAHNDLGRARAMLDNLARVELTEDRAIVCVVGTGLAGGEGCRAEVLSALAEWEPDIVALGGSPTSVAAVVAQGDLERIVCALHRRFFEGSDDRNEPNREGTGQ